MQRTCGPHARKMYAAPTVFGTLPLLSPGGVVSTICGRSNCQPGSIGDGGVACDRLPASLPILLVLGRLVLRPDEGAEKLRRGACDLLPDRTRDGLDFPESDGCPA